MKQPTTEKPVPVLYLDLDGTVRQGKDDALGKFVNGPEDVHVFPKAITLMQRWKDAGGRIVGVSNQGGVALGYVTFELVRDAITETQTQAGHLFDRIAWCIHHPDASDPEMARCWCRKPRPGMAIESVVSLGREYGEYYPPHLGLFVGDRPEDQACAEQLNVDFMWAADWRARG